MKKDIIYDSYQNISLSDLLGRIDALLAYFHTLDPAKYVMWDRLKEVMDKVIRARKEFNAKIFFVVVFGPLKAGKSTLINLLSRDFVSPTEFGSECTLRPSIIIQSPERGIDEYFTTNSSINEDVAFHLVIDYLRGLIDEKELKNYIRRESTDLTKDTMKRKLTEMCDVEPLITILRVPGGNFIGNGIALIDMPGLDGSYSNWNESPVHKWVINRSDFLVFIQSSMAAINNETTKFLKTIMEDSRKPPLWLIQNIIDAKHWRPAEKRNDDNKQQQIIAKKQISRILGVDLDFPSTQINLGKASDGIFEENLELREDSGFDDFESKLRTVLDGERAYIQEQNCLQGIISSSHFALDKLTDCYDKIESLKQEYQVKLTSLSQCIDKINGINYDNKTKLDSFLRGIDESLTSRMKDWIELLTNYAKRLKEKHNEEMNGETINQILTDFSSEISEKGVETYLNTMGEFGVSVKQSLEELLNYIEQPTISKINEILNQINRLNQNLEFIKVVYSDIPEFNNKYFNFLKVGEKNFMFIDKKYKGNEVAKIIDNVKISIEIEIKERKDFWLETLKIKYKEICTKRRNTLRNNIDNVIEHYISIMKSDLEKSENSLQLILTLQRKVTQLGL